MKTLYLWTILVDGISGETPDDGRCHSKQKAAVWVEFMNAIKLNPFKRDWPK